MTTCKKILCGFVGLYLFVALSLAHAQNTSGVDKASFKGQRFQEIYNQLNLTDVQKKQLETNKQHYRSRIQSARQAIRADQKALQQELMKPQMDRPKVNEIHSQIKSLQSQMEDDRLNSILAVRVILTPQQFLEFINMMYQHKHGLVARRAAY